MGRYGCPPVSHCPEWSYLQRFVLVTMEISSFIRWKVQCRGSGTGSAYIGTAGAIMSGYEAPVFSHGDCQIRRLHMREPKTPHLSVENNR